MDFSIGKVHRVLKPLDLLGPAFVTTLEESLFDVVQGLVDPNAIFGGVELKIPKSWSAVVQGAGIFGGYADETVQPDPGPGVKQLIIRGTATFGGVEVKN